MPVQRVGKRMVVTPVPIDQETRRSKEYLVRVKTPSAYVWLIAHYDYNYRKERPWLDHTNRPIPGRVVTVFELPDVDELEFFDDIVRKDLKNLKEKYEVWTDLS